MYQKELDAKLNNNVPIKAILLYGEDSFLIGYYGDKIAKKLLSQDCDTYYFYFNDLVYENVCSCFLQESLFGNQSFVCLKIDKKIPKKELDKWLSILKKNQSGYLVVEFYQAENRNAAQYMQDCKAMAASFRGEDVFEARFFKPYLKDSLMILQEYAKDLGVKISEFSLRKILEQQNLDLGLSVAELRKYSILEDEINVQTIESLGYGLGSVSYEEILDLLLSKKPYKNSLEQFLEQGFEEVVLIGEIQRYFFLLFLFASHIRLYGNANSEEVLGYKLSQALLDKKKNFAIRISQSQFKEIFYVLNKWREESIKGVHKKDGFLSALIKIEAILK